jgi:hypothetical protein
MMLKANQLNSEIELYRDEITNEEINTFFGNGIDVSSFSVLQFNRTAMLEEQKKEETEL